jgi:polar amino acid transport system substrate-binding protein
MAHRAGFAVVFFTAVMLCTGTLQAQAPFVLQEDRPGRRVDDFNLRYCVDKRDPAWEVDQAIGEAIAGALLLEPVVHVVEDEAVREDLDRLYLHLLRNCSIYFGFKLLPGVYPDWLTVSRPYYEVGYVLAVKNPDWQRLGDIPPGEALGPTIGTAADFRLIQYLNSLPAAERWRRFPESSDQIALTAVLNGDVAGALVWGPSFGALTKSDPAFAELRTIALDPLPISSIPVGAVMLSTETFLRSSIDEAIASLVADGTIAAILAERGFEATIPE